MTVRARALLGRIRGLVDAIRDGDEAMVEAAVLRLAGTRRWLAPLALVVSAFVMLFQGVRLVFVYWRLTVIEILPAMWIWLASFDIKLHVLHGRDFHILTGAALVAAVVGVIAVTTIGFYLNAVYAYAISQEGEPEVRPAFTRANQSLPMILGSGLVMGCALAFSALIVTRWGSHWFVLCQGIVVGLMMFGYVTVPARLIGLKKPNLSTRDKLAASALSGTLSAVVCTPPYLISRVAVLMLGSRVLFVPGIVLLTAGVTLQAGATGAVKAIKISAGLAAGRSPAPAAQPAPVDPTP